VIVVAEVTVVAEVVTVVAEVVTVVVLRAAMLALVPMMRSRGCPSPSWVAS
jgi:hypothetical protein